MKQSSLCSCLCFMSSGWLASKAKPWLDGAQSPSTPYYLLIVFLVSTHPGVGPQPPEDDVRPPPARPDLAQHSHTHPLTVAHLASRNLKQCIWSVHCHQTLPTTWMKDGLQLWDWWGLSWDLKPAAAAPLVSPGAWCLHHATLSPVQPSPLALGPRGGHSGKFFEWI